MTRLIIAVLAAAAALIAAVASGPGCGDGDGGDANGDADADAGDACGASAPTLCRGSVMDGGCGARYDPGCPPCLPVAGTPCSGSLHCDYCRYGWFDPSDWTMTWCSEGRWHLLRTHCDPPFDGGPEADADMDADADAEVDLETEVATDVGAEVGLDDGLDADSEPGDVGDVDAPLDAGEPYTSWTDCGWTDGTVAGSCLCDGLAACEAIAAGVWEPLGSHEIRVCARRAGSCDVAFFREVEGGGTGFRCTIPTSGTCGFDEAHDCEAVFSCNLLMGDCPSGVVPTNVIPCDLAFGP
ncbi:MAG: hypothetical protein HY905_08395 [Deltaproteobacteria bacterium]|nr:hypothetical protein [Deltaproteobacteria bacterium]